VDDEDFGQLEPDYAIAIAIDCRCADIFECLLTAGADVSIKFVRKCKLMGEHYQYALSVLEYIIVLDEMGMLRCLFCHVRDFEQVRSCANAALGLAISLDRSSMVEMFCNDKTNTIDINAPCDYNSSIVQTEIGQSPLEIAVLCKHTDILRILLEAGAEIKAHMCVREDMIPIVLFAAESDDITLCRMLLMAGASLYETHPHSHKTALIAAVQNRNLDMVKMITELGCMKEYAVYSDTFFNAHDATTAHTALTMAVQNSDTEIVEELLCLAAVDVNVMKGTTYKSSARNAGTHAAHTLGTTAISIAIANSNLNIVRLLLQTGEVYLNDQQFNGEVHPLVLAMQIGNYAVIQALLKSGASLASLEYIPSHEQSEQFRKIIDADKFSKKLWRVVLDPVVTKQAGSPV